MNLRDRYQAMIDGVRPAPELDREVVAEARRLRDARGACDTGGACSSLSPVACVVAEKPRRGRPLFSRRSFATAAFGLGAAVLAVGVPAALRRRGETSPGLPADRPQDVADLPGLASDLDGAPSAPDSASTMSAARCGLAMLGAGSTAGPVPATSAGIVPVSCMGAFGSMDLRIDLSLWGEGLASARYSLAGVVPLYSTWPVAGWSAELRSAVFLPAGPNGDTSRWYMGIDGEGGPLEGTVGEDGSFLCSPDGAYLLCCGFSYDEVRSIDPVLDAFWDWNTPYQQTVLPPEPTAEQEAQALEATWVAAEQADRLNAMLDELYGDPEAFYEWMRGCYVSMVGLLGRWLQKAVLTLEATFADGAVEWHGYRIRLADDYEEAVAGRFDALVESSPYDVAGGAGSLFYEHDGVRDWSFMDLPFGRLLDGQPFDEVAAADERLSRPLFVVEELLA